MTATQSTQRFRWLLTALWLSTLLRLSWFFRACGEAFTEILLLVIGANHEIDEEKDWRRVRGVGDEDLSALSCRAANRRPDDRIISCHMPNGEVFMFIYRAETAREMMLHLGRLAADPSHPLTWGNVATMTQMIRNDGCLKSVLRHGPSQDG